VAAQLGSYCELLGVGHST